MVSQMEHYPHSMAILSGTKRVVHSNLLPTGLLGVLDQVLARVASQPTQLLEIQLNLWVMGWQGQAKQSAQGLSTPIGELLDIATQEETVVRLQTVMMSLLSL